jgi:hypothetical protein
VGDGREHPLDGEGIPDRNRGGRHRQPVAEVGRKAAGQRPGAPRRCAEIDAGGRKTGLEGLQCGGGDRRC